MKMRPRRSYPSNGRGRSRGRGRSKGRDRFSSQIYQHDYLPHSTGFYNQRYGYNKYKYSKPPLYNKNKKKIPSRPVSPVQGSEEYMVRKIEQTSAIIMKHLLNPEEQFLKSGSNIEAENENEDFNDKIKEKNCPNGNINNETSCSINNKVFKVKENTTNIDEIHEKIMNHITKLNEGRKKNLINSHMSGYDAVIEKIQAQKRLEISQALRYMYSQSTHADASNDFINSIIPDIGIDIEDLPLDIIEEFKSTIHFNCGDDFSDYFFTQSSNRKSSDKVTDTFCNITNEESPINSCQNSEKFASNAIEYTKKMSMEHGENCNKADNFAINLRKIKRETDSDNGNEIMKDFTDIKDSFVTVKEKFSEQDLKTIPVEELHLLRENIDACEISKDDKKNAKNNCTLHRDNLSIFTPSETLSNKSECFNRSMEHKENYSDNADNIPINLRKIQSEIDSDNGNEIINDYTDIEDSFVTTKEEFSEQDLKTISVEEHHLLRENVDVCEIGKDDKENVKNNCTLYRDNLSVLTQSKTPSNESEFSNPSIEHGENYSDKADNLAVNVRKIKRETNSNSGNDIIKDYIDIEDSFVTVKEEFSEQDLKTIPVDESHLLRENIDVCGIGKDDKENVKNNCTLYRDNLSVFTQSETPSNESEFSNRSMEHGENYSDNADKLALNLRKVKREIDSDSGNNIMKNNTDLEDSFVTVKEFSEQDLKTIAVEEPHLLRENVDVCEKVQDYRTSVKNNGTLYRDNLSFFTQTETPLKSESGFSNYSTGTAPKSCTSDVEIQTDDIFETQSAEQLMDYVLERHCRNKPENLKEAIHKMFEIDLCITKLTKYRQSLFMNLNAGSAPQNFIQCKASSSKVDETDILPNKRKRTLAVVESESRKKMTKKTNSNTSVKEIQITRGLEHQDLHEKVLVIKVEGEHLIAGTESGKIIFYSLHEGCCIKILHISTLPITSLLIINNEGSKDTYIYAGLHENVMKIYNFHNYSLIKNIPLDDSIQCMEFKWDYIFIGCFRGLMLRYSVKKKVIKYEEKFSDDSIMVLKATHEGARRVLLVGSRNSPVFIRDAMTGLYMRTMEDLLLPTVYSLLMENGLIYCGTTNHDILVYSFYNGKLVHRHKVTDSKGIGCMKIRDNILFASCHNGNIYVFDIKKNVLIAKIEGPGGVILSMEVYENQIIVGTMSFKFASLPIPQHILNHKSR